MDKELQTDLILLIPLILQLGGLVFAVQMDSYVKRTHRIIMLIIVASVFLLILQNIAEYALEYWYSYPMLRTMTAIAGYCMRPMILLLFFYIVDESKDYKRSWILVGINAAVYMSAMFNGMAFSITPENRFERGPLGYCAHVISAILLVHLLYLSLHKYGRVHKSDIVIPISNAVIIVLSVIADSVLTENEFLVNWLTVATVCSCVFYYIWLHLQFVRQYESSLQAEQRIQLMMSQIQPHFLFNTLSTIQSLCLIDPPKASETVEKFGIYLRQNLETMNQPKLIPFEKELEHVKIYADIEMIRFPSIRVQYFIEDSDFSLPALSVQPLVENSIRHGVRIKDEGLVTVRSWRDIDQHVITITDNGTGFDVEKAEQSDRSHIGLRNVRERIEKMCGGSFDIQSRLGEGTSITIRIPAEQGII